MLLSVLIPTCNYRCYRLVAELHRQLEQSGVEYEIIVAEDGSRDQVSIISNLRISELANCRHVIRRDNVGRAAIRNYLASEAKGEWLLFIDSDAVVVRDNFIASYLSSMESAADIVSGDLVNPEQMPSPGVSLRYRYEKSYEPMRSAVVRSKSPYDRLTTFNLMMRRSLWSQIPFDEDCVEYGYEDTLMGIELKRSGKNVLHIDNPLMHVGFERNEVYLSKVETSLRTLHGIKDRVQGETRMTSLHDRIDRLGLLWMLRLAFVLSRPMLRRNLLGNRPDMTVFSFYKLGYYSCL